MLDGSKALRLQVPPTLARTLRSINAIEPMISICRDHARNVKRWCDGTMALRWCAAGMAEAGNSAGSMGSSPRRSTKPQVSRPCKAGSLKGRGEIERSGLFSDVVVRHFDWEISYTAQEYLRLLDTFSGHIAMQAGKRERLYAEISRRLAQRPDGRLRRHWGAVLHVARRADPSPTT